MQVTDWYRCNMEKTVVLLIEILIFLSFGSSHLCKPHENSTVIDCSGLGLPTVPHNLSVHATRLDLSCNNITTLYNNDFSELTNLQYLDLSINPISMIQVDAFNGLNTLIELQIFGHVLNYTDESLPLDAFKPLQSLQTLRLRSNMYRFQRKQPKLPYQAISILDQLTELNIDTTPNTVFQKEFSNLKNLQYLFLGNINYKSYTFECALTQMTNETFSVFHSIPIQLLELSNCRFLTFNSDSLEALPHLQTFLFNDVYYYNGDVNDILKALAVYRNKSMELISIATFYSRYVTIADLDILSQICVSKLEISRARISEFNIDVLLTPPFPLFTKCVKEINLRYNNILTGMDPFSFVFFSVFSQLQKIDVSLQFKFQFNRCAIVKKQPPATERFNIGLPILLPSNLRYFDIAGLPTWIGEMCDVFFFHGENLIHLNLSYSGLYDFYHNIYGLPNLQVLDFSGNDLSILKENFFDTFPNLTTLRLYNTLLDSYFMIQNGSRLFSPLIKLEILDVSNNDLVSLPRDIFSALKNLQLIDLTKNKLVSIPDVTSLMFLKHVHMSYNGLTTLDQTTQNMLDRTSDKNPQFQISLFGNVFYCGCPSLQFLLWLKETRARLDGRNYTCMDELGHVTSTASVFNDLIYLERFCSSPFWTNMAIGGLCSTFLCLGLGFVFLKNKLKFQLFFLRLIGQNVYPKERRDFVNDVAVIPELDSNRRFIHNSLMVALKTNRGLKVDLGQIGRSEMINIVESIRDSWKIILIVTSDFLTSDFCLFTICNCLSAITMTTPNRIILLLDNQARIPPNIHFLFEAISQDNVFHFDIGQPVHDDFWTRVYHRLIFEENE